MMKIIAIAVARPLVVVLLLIKIGSLLYFEGGRRLAPLSRSPECSPAQTYSGLPSPSDLHMDPPRNDAAPSAPIDPGLKTKDPFKHNITTLSLLSLREKMDAYYSQRDLNIGGTTNAEARRFLKYLVELKMVPTLPKVPITKTIPADLKKLSKGQEHEDIFIYEHFYNEATMECHQFGSQLFESGALDGIQYSNTLMFERHFQMPTILVEASQVNWDRLVQNGSSQRPLAKLNHAAMCPVGVESICMSDDINSMAMHKVDRNQSSCQDATPCFSFDETLHYSFFSLDIEGFELDFLKLRKPKADIMLIEVIQWARFANELSTLIELVAYLADIGYYLYEEPIGFRNFLFVSHELATDCSGKFGML